MPFWDHTLKPNKSTVAPSRFLFVDTEALVRKLDDNREHHKLAFGYALYWRRRDKSRGNDTTILYRFTSGEQLADIVEKRATSRATLHIVAHNVAYDLALSSLPDYLQGRGWELSGIYAKNQVVIIRLKKGNRRIIIMDSLNIFPGKLTEWAKVLGMEKQQIDWDNPDLVMLDRRCRTDVEILHRLFEQWIATLQEEDLGSFRRTAAGQSFAVYRHRFMKDRITIHANLALRAFERCAYHGGLVKVFRVGHFAGVRLHKLDINSAYPFVMRINRYPVKFIAMHPRPSIEALREVLQHCCVIADVTIAPPLPVLPRTIKQITIYPMYPFRTVLCTPELQFLLEHNAILEVHAIAGYKQRSPFTEFVEYMYGRRMQARRNGEKCKEQLYKLMLNSLYGKWGARRSTFKHYPDYDDLASSNIELVDVSNGKVRRVFFWAGKAYLEETDDKSYDTFVAIAAHVTAYARMYLVKLIEQAGVENVYYVDTDSLIVNDEGLIRLTSYIDPEKLGMLKYEGYDDDVIIASRKFYRFGGKWVVKGAFFSGEVAGEAVFAREEWPTIRKVLVSKDTSTVTVVRKRLNLDGKVYDGVVSEDGKVIPFYTPPDIDQDPMSLPTLLNLQA